MTGRSLVHMHSPAIKPFLKWAGGKFRSLGHILHVLPPGVRLVEPFAGAGSVSFNAVYTRFLLCDTNTDLISLFTALQQRGEAFIADCKQLYGPDSNTPECYYARRRQFNESSVPEERAALLVYLNRHCFNGLTRYNASGYYNVPFGRFKAPFFPESGMQAVLGKLRQYPMVFALQDFRTTFAGLEDGDVVYADPPYVPLSPTASFTTYEGTTFTLDDHADLARLARQAARNGVPVVLSNHDTALTRTLYAGARVQHFAVQRYISCRGAQRRSAPELLAVFSCSLRQDRAG